ncbi:MAG: hypothetical protein OXC31_19705, partial [Spirochaetaceae bacterium]|nr:hypothetical protein [Spirochaetaceae bacterium]
MVRNLPGRLSRQLGRADSAFVRNCLRHTGPIHNAILPLDPFGALRRLWVVSRRKGNKAKGKLLKSKSAMAHCVMVAATVGATGCQVGGANFANRVDLPAGAFVNTATTAEAKPEADAVPAQTAAYEGLMAAKPANAGSTGTTLASAPDWPGALIGARNLAVLPRFNRYADDLLDHWGHRQIDGIRARSGRGPNGGATGTLQSVRAADRATTAREIVPQLEGGDTVEVLGERLGVHTGRWTGGLADTLSIEFNFDHASEAIRENRAFQAIVDRAGKAWSHRIADTWSTWHRPEGWLKTYFLPNGDVSDEIRVESGGETSTGLEIVVTALDAAESGGKPSQALIGIGGVRATTKWEPHDGAIRIIREPTSDFGTFFTAVHEIGHVIGAWFYSGGAAHFAPYADLERGTWHGRGVTAG